MNQGSFFLFLNWDNSHTISKCTVQQCLVYLQGCATITTIQFQNLSSPKKSHTHYRSPFSSVPSPWETTNQLSISMDLPIEPRYFWSQIIITNVTSIQLTQETHKHTDTHTHTHTHPHEIPLWQHLTFPSDRQDSFFHAIPLFQRWYTHICPTQGASHPTLFFFCQKPWHVLSGSCICRVILR